MTHYPSQITVLGALLTQSADALHKPYTLKVLEYGSLGKASAEAAAYGQSVFSRNASLPTFIQEMAEEAVVASWRAQKRSF